MAVIQLTDISDRDTLYMTRSTSTTYEKNDYFAQQYNFTPKPAVEEKLWYSVAEIAQLLDLSRGVVYELIRSGRLQSIRVGGGKLIRVTHQALMAYLQSG